MAPSSGSSPAEANAVALADAYKLDFEEQKELVLNIILSWSEVSVRVCCSKFARFGDDAT